MQHPDEGTIHAWLDGALDEHEAAQLAAHVATCAECEARVVEARGLIAGASRVLSALDAVPGGVIPAASSSPAITPGRDEEREEPPRTTRHWWRRRGITPALAAAAAVAFVAAGSVLVTRLSEPHTMFDRAERVTMAPQPAAAPSVPPSAQPQAGAAVGQIAPRVAAPVPTSVANAPITADSTGVEPSRSAPASKATAAFGAADRVAAEPSVRRDASVRSPADSSASAPRSERLSEESPRVMMERVPSQAQQKKPAAMPSVSPGSVAAAAGVAAPAPAARAGAAMEQRARAAGAPPLPRPSLVANFAGCYRVVSGDAAEAGGTMPRAFVLDTTPVAVAGDSTQDNAFALVRAYVVRDTSLRARGRWSALGPTARVRWDGLPMVLELRAGTAARFEGVVRQDGRAATVMLERCGGR